MEWFIRNIMRSRKYLYIFLVAITLGFIHGYYITSIKNKDRIEEAHQSVNSNYLNHIIKVDRIINEEGIEEGKVYVDKLNKRNRRNYDDFLLENPGYVPLSERKNEN